MITITDNQIRTLMYEAGIAGDTAMVDACVAALDGSADARELCAEAIDDAAAMDDGGAFVRGGS